MTKRIRVKGDLKCSLKSSLLSRSHIFSDAPERTSDPTSLKTLDCHLTSTNSLLDHSWIPQIRECCFASFVAIFLNLTESRTMKLRSRRGQEEEIIIKIWPQSRKKNDMIITLILLCGSTELEFSNSCFPLLYYILSL